MSDLGDRITNIISESGKRATPSEQSNAPAKAHEIPSPPQPQPPPLPRIHFTVNLTPLIAIVLICIAGCVGFYIWSTSNRYSLTPGASGQVYQIDTKTGQAWLLMRGEKHNVDEPKPTPAPTTPVTPVGPSELTEGEMSRCDVRMQKETSYTVLHGSIHNHTDKTLSKITLIIKTKRWERAYDTTVFVEPFKSGPFSISPYDGEFSWDSFSVSAIYGR